MYGNAQKGDLPVTVTDVTGNTTTNSYNSLNQLTTTVQANGPTTLHSFSYAYDPVGNQTSQTLDGTTTTMTYNAVNELTAAGGVSYTYDRNGNRVSTSLGGAFTYNAKNQTTSMTPAGGSAISYTFDGSGTRLSEGSTQFKDAATGMTSATTGAGTWDFTSNPGGGILSQQTPSKGTDYYLTDGAGSVVGLTDSSGTVVAQASYDPKGNTVSQSGTEVLWANGDGASKDTDSGMYSNGSSLYDPSTASSNQLTWGDMAGGGSGGGGSGGYTCGQLGCVQTGGSEDCGGSGLCYSTNSSWGVPPTNFDPYNGVYTDPVYLMEGNGCTYVAHVYHYWWGEGILMNSCLAEQLAVALQLLGLGMLGASAFTAEFPPLFGFLVAFGSYAGALGMVLSSDDQHCNGAGAWLNHANPFGAAPFFPVLWVGAVCISYNGG